MTRLLGYALEIERVIREAAADGCEKEKTTWPTTRNPAPRNSSAG